MKRCVLVVGLITFGSMTSSRSHACCNSFPGTASSVMQFDGTRGTLASPFLVPGELLRITRRTCDDPGNTTFPADTPDDVRTVVVVRPDSKNDRPHVIVLKRGPTNGPCGDADTFTANCKMQLVGTGGDADCFTVAHYDVQPSVLDIELPAIPPGNPPRSTASRAAVAVLRNGDPATVCGDLAKGNHCSQAIGAPVPLLACIDQIGLTNAASPCKPIALHPVFPEATLLPTPNDLKNLCHKPPTDPFCDQQPAGELRYGVDQPGNVLIPMWWERSLKACAGQTLRIHGEVRSPCTLEIPDNHAQSNKNTWLESYTFDGRLNVPWFGKETPSNSILNRFTGTTEEPFSVLRFGAHYGRCSSSAGETCNHADQCSALGDTCDSICTKSNAPCGPTQPCPNGAGECGKLHDFRPEYSGGRWRVGRDPQTPSFCTTSNDPHGFCEDVPSTLCNGQGQCRPSGDCASYLLTLDGCERPDVGARVPPTLEARTKDLPPVFGPLLRALGIFQDVKLVAAAFSDDAIALIVPGVLLQDKAPRCASPDVKNVLVAASTATCQDGSCLFTCPRLDAGMLFPGLAVYGTKVRFLQFPEVTTAAPGMFNAVVRFFRGVFRFVRGIFGGTGGQVPPPGPPLQAFLRILDTATSAVATVGEVVINDPEFNPFAIGPSGATKMRANLARCVMTSGGRTLGIPSFCHPGGGGECPSWATCQPTDIIMVMDLSRTP